MRRGRTVRARRLVPCGPKRKVHVLPLLLLQLLFGHHLLVLVSPQLPGAVFKGEDFSPCREETGSEPARGSECWGPPPDSGSSSPFVSFKRAVWARGGPPSSPHRCCWASERVLLTFLLAGQAFLPHSVREVPRQLRSSKWEYRDKNKTAGEKPVPLLKQHSSIHQTMVPLQDRVEPSTRRSGCPSLAKAPAKPLSVRMAYPRL